MSRPRASTCADCGAALDYGSGRWMNIAPMGAKEKIVCRQCWRLKHRKTQLPVVGDRLPIGPKTPPGRPLEGHQPAAEAGVHEVLEEGKAVPAIQAVAAAFRALVARAVRDEVSRELSKALAKWRRNE